MSDTRVELRVSFLVSSDHDRGREAAQRVISAIEHAAEHGRIEGCSDLTVSRGAVNGNDWEDRWPDATQTTADPTCGAYSRYQRYGGVLGPCNKTPDHGAEWHLDDSGAAWDPAIDA